MRLLLLIVATGLDAQTLRFTLTEPSLLESRLRSIVSDNGARAELLHKLFAEAGCERLEAQAARGSKLKNIVCSLPGETEDLVIVSAHYDKVKDGAGAIDNWTGASLLPSLYEGMARNGRPRHTYLFIGFTDEEVGLVGSRAWVDAHKKTHLTRVHAVVNIDSIATGPLRIWASRAHPGLTAFAAAVGKTLQIPVYGMNVDNVGDSDTAPFLRRKIPVIDFHSLTDETFPLLHTTKDQLEAVKADEYKSSYKLIQVFLTYIDSNLPLPPPDRKP